MTGSEEDAAADPSASLFHSTHQVPGGVREGCDPIFASLREREELLALAQEAGGFGIFEWQVQTGKVTLSPKLCSLYGLTNFDGTYGTWLGRIFREDLLRLKNDIQDAFDAHVTEMLEEFRFVRADGDTLRWMERRSIISPI